MNMLKQLCQLFQPNSISSHKNQSIKHLPTIFNLQKCYHPVSFICEWSMPLYKIKRKEKYSSIEAELSLLVYLLYLFMGQTIHFHLKQIRPLHTGISLQNSFLVNHFIMQTPIVLCTIVHCELFAIAVFQKLEEDSGNGILEFPTLLIQVFEGHRYEIVTDSIPAECLTQKLEQCS